MQLTPFRLTRTRALAALVAVAGMIGLAGCHTGPSVTKQNIGFSIQASRATALAGETVTFTTYTQNLVGANANIHWTTTGGELHPLENGARARVQFNDPGIYYVIADLVVNGTRVRSATAVVKVVPVRREQLPNEGNANQPNASQGANGQSSGQANTQNENENNQQEQGQTMYK